MLQVGATGINQPTNHIEFLTSVHAGTNPVLTAEILVHSV
jgi:hypothetical protein